MSHTTTKPTTENPIPVKPLDKPIRRHPLPQLSKLVHSSYSPPLQAQPGHLNQNPIESNLLILLHGLGDTHEPFFKLGQQFNLPQTCILSIRAPLGIPLLEEEDAFQWVPSFDQLGELIPNPNPTSTVQLLIKVIDHLVTLCQWRPEQLHFFGNSQGGSILAELSLALSRLPSNSNPITTLGSIISIQGPFFSFPTPTNKIKHTKVLLVVRKGKELSIGQNGWKKAFDQVQSLVLDDRDERDLKGPMPRGEKEWYGILRFWSRTLVQRSEIEFQDDVYQVQGVTAQFE